MFTLQPLPSNDYYKFPYYESHFKKTAQDIKVTTQDIRKSVKKKTCKLPTKNIPCRMPPKKIYYIESHTDNLKKTLNNLNKAFNNLQKEKKFITKKKTFQKFKKLEKIIFTLRQNINNILRKNVQK